MIPESTRTPPVHTRRAFLTPRVIAFILVAIQAVSMLTAGAAQSPTDMDADAAPSFRLPTTIGADYFEAFPKYVTDESFLAAMVAAQFEQQGLLPPGTAPSLDTFAAKAAGNRPLPPGLRYQDAHASCDLDADGTEDVVMNEMALSNPPYDTSGDARLKALSGTNASILWKRDPVFYTTLILPSGMSYVRYGEALPRGPRNMAEASDLDADGVCDYVEVGLRVTNRLNVILGPSITDFETRVTGVSGADGSDIWNIRIPGRIIFYQDIFSAVTYLRISEFPTGFLAFDSPSGPKVVLKTTDITYERVVDVTGISGAPAIDNPVFDNPYNYANATSGDHVRLYDAMDATLFWHRIIQANADPDHTRLGWLTGATDLAGDAEYEIVLDQVVFTNPRSSEAKDPITGKPVARYSKGMRMLALEGELEGTGSTLWETVIFDPLAVRANPPVEEPFEQLVWTHATLLGDLDGDGRAEPTALWIAIEENMPATVAGLYRTHVVPLSGADGSILWEVRQQGWGHVESLAVNEDSPPMVGMGFLDVPTPPPRGGRFPPKFVRLVGADGTDGSTVWSYEKRFAQNSFTVYSMALGQFQTSLAPFDWNGDGIKDLITPSQYAKPAGKNQVLLAMSNHSYDILSGANGEVLRTIKSWGPDGRVVACAGAEPYVTTVSGHARRMDVTRFDIATGEQVFRRPLYNDPAPRAATSAIDITAFGARCDDDAAGRTIFSFNMQAFSFDRRNEVIAVQAVVDGDGITTWQSPDLRGNPPTTLIFEPYVNTAGEATIVDTIITLGVSGFLGVGLGLASVMVWNRRRVGGGNMGGTLGITIVLLLVGLTLAPLATPAATLDDATIALTQTKDRLGREIIDVSALEAPTATRAAATPDVERAARDLAEPVAPQEATRGPRAEPTPRAGDRDDSTPLAGAGAIGDLATGLRALGDAWTPDAHLALITQYFTDLGFNTAMAGGDTKDRFEENVTLSYAYEIGDVDGDGTGDIVLDEYCIDYDACDRACCQITDFVTAWTVPGSVGTSPHHLWAISGADGKAIWNQSLDTPRPLASTATSFVLGTIPTSKGVGILVYKYVVTGIGEVVLEHEYYLVDANTGDKMWSFTDVGAYATDLFREFADTVVINPIIQVPIGTGLNIVAPGTVDALFLQGVGFETDSTHSFYAPPGFNHAITVTNAYRANEWAAKIDIETGIPEWRRVTFTPDPALAVVPQVLDLPSFRFNYGLPASVEAMYWASDRCCFDTTGDGIPDILYKVYEWNPLRATNVNGPYDLDARLVIIDGATGEVTIDMYLQQDIGFSYEAYYQTLGDVNGDGIGDFAIHEVFYDFQYRHIVTVRNGPDAAEIWRIESPRDLRIFVIGDATGDGGNDFVYVDWYLWEIGIPPFVMAEDLVTVQRLPVTLYDGATGEQVWRVHTISAPSDTLVELGMLRLNGLPDFDQDGVGDFTIDDPLYLGDQTVIHRQSILSGRTAATLFTIESVGAFGIPTRVTDITGDGIEDLAILSGDLNDLWVSTYDGQNGDPQWSRRLLALASSNSARAIPRIRFLSIDLADTAANDVLVNFHMYVTSASRIVYGNGDGVAEYFYVYETITPQILRFEGPNGNLEWAFPRVEDPALLAVVSGQSPGTQTYHAIKASLAEAPMREVKTAALGTLPPMGAFSTGYLAVILIAFIGSRLKRSPRDEVPNLL